MNYVEQSSSMGKEDKGHEALTNDIEVLLSDAKDFAFHDFKNEKYAAPKMVLKARLETMAQAVVDGKYDN